VIEVPAVAVVAELVSFVLESVLIKKFPQPAKPFAPSIAANVNHLPRPNRPSLKTLLTLSTSFMHAMARETLAIRRVSEAFCLHKPLNLASRNLDEERSWLHDGFEYSLPTALWRKSRNLCSFCFRCGLIPR
jgi:hypothetical protein